MMHCLLAFNHYVILVVKGLSPLYNTVTLQSIMLSNAYSSRRETKQLPCVRTSELNES